MSISLELSFKRWLQGIIDSRIRCLWDLDNLPRSQTEWRKLVTALQFNTTENEFQTIVLLSDNCCECNGSICLFCHLYDFTEHITASAYLNLVPLDYEDISNLR